MQVLIFNASGLKMPIHAHGVFLGGGGANPLNGEQSHRDHGRRWDCETETAGWQGAARAQGSKSNVVPTCGKTEYVAPPLTAQCHVIQLRSSSDIWSRLLLLTQTSLTDPAILTFTLY